MTQADTSRLQLSYIAESTFGELKTGANLQIIRFTSESLKKVTQTTVSNEIRSDRQRAGVTRNRITAAGGINTELSYGAHDDLMKSALMSAVWSTPVTIGPITTISAASADNSFNDSGSGFATLAANQWIKVSGFTEAANNGYFKIVSKTTAKIVVSGGTLVAEVAGDSVTIVMGAYLANGTTFVSYNIEKYFTDLTTTFHKYTGMCIDQMSLDIAADAIMTGGFEFLGKDAVSAAATSGTGYTAAPTADVMSAVDNLYAFLEAQASVGIISMSLQVRNNLRDRIQAGTLGALSIGTGAIDVSGTLRTYFASASLMDKYLNFTDTTIAAVVEDGAGNAYVIDLPNVKYTDGSVVAGGVSQDIIADMSFIATVDATESITIKIARFAA
jgi:hypothetical protein